jgi:hypothetical protein
MIDHDYQSEEYERATSGEWDSDWDGDNTGAASWGVIAVIGMIIAGGLIVLRIKGVI